MSISSLEQGQLQSIMFYGIGGFIFFYLSIFAIILFYVYTYAQNRDAAPIYSTFFKIFYAYVGLTAFLTIFYSILIVFSHSKISNPAVGLYGFFELPWENVQEALSAIESSPAYTESPTAQQQTYKLYVLIVSSVKMLYVIMTVGVYLFVPLFSIYYPYVKCNEEAEKGSLSPSCMLNAALAGTIYSGGLFLLLLMSQTTINYLIDFAANNGYASGIEGTVSHFDVFRDAFERVREIMNEAIKK